MAIIKPFLKKTPRPMAEGGVVKATEGGTPIIAGEGGQDEAVIPLPDEEESDPCDEHAERIADLEAQLAEANTRADTVAQAFFTARVAGLDLLADPTSIGFDPGLLDAGDDDLQEAVIALIAAQPELGKMRVTGDIDQGPREELFRPPSLVEIMKALA